jgi:hypothetical protein
MLIDSFAKIITLPVRLSNATRSIEQYLLVKSQQSWKHFNACAVVYIRSIYDSFPSFVSIDIEVGVIHELPLPRSNVNSPTLIPAYIKPQQ